MAWLYLLVAGLFECVWAVGLKYTEGFTRPLPMLATAAAMLVSFALLTFAMEKIPIGTAYAVWTGIGAVGVAIFGIVVLGESASLPRLLSIAVVVAGIAGLRIFSEY